MRGKSRRDLTKWARTVFNNWMSYAPNRKRKVGGPYTNPITPWTASGRVSHMIFILEKRNTTK